MLITGESGLNPAIEWLFEHADDPEPTKEELNKLEINNETASKKLENEHDEDVVKMAVNEKPQRTQEEIEKEAARYQGILEKKRGQRSREEELEKSRAENERRKLGREMQNIRQKMKEDEMYRAIEERKREKQKDSEYLKQLKMQLELERRERFEDSVPRRDSESPETIPMTPPFIQANSNTETHSNSRIQIIIPDSPRLLKVFPSSSPLSEVYDFVFQETGKVNFDLMPLVKINNYDPKFKEKSLDSLGLARGASLILTPWS